MESLKTNKTTSTSTHYEKTPYTQSIGLAKTQADAVTLDKVAKAVTLNSSGNSGNDELSKIAKAVAWAETHDCTRGYGKIYNNCFGIKNGNTAPCPKIGKNRMCIYERPEQSYEAFKVIWSKWYGGGLPTYSGAARWTGNDRPDSWLRNVRDKYNSL